MDHLTTGDVHEITGLPPTTLVGWVNDGILKPIAGGGKGRGNHHQFSLMQVVGIAIGAALRKSERSCALSYVGLVVDAFGNMTEEQLLKQFDRGATHLVTIHQGKPILGAKEYDWTDVQKVYRDVKQGMAKLSRKPANLTGRNRGLAGTSES